METWLTGLFVIAPPAAIGSLITYFFFRATRNEAQAALEERLQAAQKELKDMSQRLEGANDKLRTALTSKARNQEEARRIPELESDLTKLKGENFELQQQVNGLQKKQGGEEDWAQWLERAEKRLHETFKTLSDQALETNTTEFLKRVHGHLDHVFQQIEEGRNLDRREVESLVEPWTKTLETLDMGVRQLEQRYAGGYQRLEEHLSQLGETHQELQRSTNALIHALKAPTARGVWGKVQLRRIVEMAGLIEHVDFNEQAGNGERPDLIVYLPNKVILPVDARIPLQDYLETAADSDNAALLEGV